MKKAKAPVEREEQSLQIILSELGDAALRVLDSEKYGLNAVAVRCDRRYDLAPYMFEKAEPGRTEKIARVQEAEEQKVRRAQLKIALQVLKAQQEAFEALEKDLKRMPQVQDYGARQCIRIILEASLKGVAQELGMVVADEMQ